MTECPRENFAECPCCSARPGEDCPLDTPSTIQLLDRQQAVTAAATGFCNPSEGVCDSCQ
jgi:hypothetical protein